MEFRFFASTDLLFGNGTVKKLPEVVQRRGLKKVLLVYGGKSVKANGTVDLILDGLKGAGVECAVYDGVLPNPTGRLVEEAAALAKEEKVEGFVALGGGSSIDLAKAANVLMTNPGRISDYGGMGMVKNDCLPLVAIPTTAGTSSEITNVSALIDEEKVIKYVVIDDHIVPTDVICDPELTRTMPPSVTAATGMDAITHAVESYISNMASPLTRVHSIEGLKILYQNLPAAVKDGNDLAAREQMMLGCIITGWAFSNANLGLVHAIAHTLSAHFGLAHGMANAAVLPYVMAYNAEAVPEEMVALAEAIGEKPSGDLSKDKLLLSEALRRLTETVQIKSLEAQGVEHSAFDRLAEDTLKEPVLSFNPRQGVTKEDVLKLLEQAY